MKKTVKGLQLILGYLGIFLIFESVIPLFPLVMLFFYPKEWQVFLDFVIPSVVSLGIGLALFFAFFKGKEKARLGKREDALLLVLLWIAAIVIGAFPFFLSQFGPLNFNNPEASLGMSYPESFFEATSGLTTTGLTVFPQKAYLDGVISSVGGIDSCSTYPFAHMFLFHRAWLQFLGGVGLVLIVTSIISNKTTFKLYFAEGHTDQAVPNLVKSAKLILIVYAGWIILGSLALWLAGMPPFEAICTSMCCLATGGFATRSSSIYWFSNNMPQGNVTNLLYSVPSAIGIEIITCILMIAGAINFLLHIFFIRGRFKDFFGDIEIKLMFGLLIFSTLLTSVSAFELYDEGAGLDFLTSLRYGAYFSVTSLTTSGFANFPSVLKLGPVCIFIGWVLMTIGGGMGSTAGGIKQYRIGILGKEFFWFFKYHDSSSKTINPHPHKRFGEVKEVKEGTVKEALNFTVIVLCFFFTGAVAMMFLPKLDGLNSTSWFQRCFYEFMNAFSSEGMSMMAYTEYKALQPTAYVAMLWILTTGMFFGRLEITPIIFAGSRLFVTPVVEYRKRRKKEKMRQSI